MSTLSVPLTPELEKFIEEQVRDGAAANKADVVRRALYQAREDAAFSRLQQSLQDVKDGKVYEGDLMELIKHID